MSEWGHESYPRDIPPTLVWDIPPTFWRKIWDIPPTHIQISLQILKIQIARNRFAVDKCKTPQTGAVRPVSVGGYPRKRR